MGIFHPMTKIYNRTTESDKPQVLQCRFDGQDINIPLGYSELPTIAIPYARTQNVIRGSEPDNEPSFYESLVAVVGRDECTPARQPDGVVTRVDPTEMLGPGKTRVIADSKRRATIVDSIGSAFENPTQGI